jgi:hypothetical protein
MIPGGTETDQARAAEYASWPSTRAGSVEVCSEAARKSDMWVDRECLFR